MQISVVMLIFLLFLDKIFGGRQTASGEPPVEENHNFVQHQSVQIYDQREYGNSQARKSLSSDSFSKICLCVFPIFTNQEIKNLGLGKLGVGIKQLFKCFAVRCFIPRFHLWVLGFRNRLGWGLVWQFYASSLLTFQ